MSRARAALATLVLLPGPLEAQGPAGSYIELPLLPAQPKAVRFNDLEGALADVKMVSWTN